MDIMNNALLLNSGMQILNMVVTSGHNVHEETQMGY